MKTLRNLMVINKYFSIVSILIIMQITVNTICFNDKTTLYKFVNFLVDDNISTIYLKILFIIVYSCTNLFIVNYLVLISDEDKNYVINYSILDKSVEYYKLLLTKLFPKI